MAKRILVVDDEVMIVKGIHFSLLQDGYEVECAYDGEEAVEKARTGNFDLVLLDVMLPKKDGFAVCAEIRSFSEVPVIMLTAKGDDMDKILGLDNGADDYITKPFNILEVKARIKAILRRNAKAEPVRSPILAYRGLSLDKETRRVLRDGKELRLTNKEFEILELLMSNPGTQYSRDKLLELVWGADYDGDARTVDVHIRRLREKVEINPAEPEYIFTRWGAGYYFKA